MAGGRLMSIDVQYSADSDTLLLWTGAPAADAEEVAEGVFVDFDADGNVVGIRLERAAVLLWPMLDAACADHVAGGERPTMNDQQLVTTLRAVGMACFVRYYEYAADASLPQRIRNADGYSPVACQTRASGIRSIVIRHGRGKDALAIIANSNKVDAATRTKAAALLAQSRPGPSAGGTALAMNDQQLMTTLRAVGMACFVRYYEYAYDASLAQRIRDDEGYTTYRQRASEIRSIVVRYGRGKDALAIIANSRNVDAATRQKAAALLAQL